ncbi:MAG: DUF4832 domain-containing protein [Acidobacteriaceae bacterium]
MRFRKFSVVALGLGLAAGLSAQQTTVVVKPIEIHDVLVNPGIGFMTFQRFNGDRLNAGTKWTEGFPIEYQPFQGTLKNKDFPMTSIAYFRVYWRFLEPGKGVYRWHLIDQALQTAHGRHQTLMLRVAPHGTDEKSDVPVWYRQETGEKFHKIPGGWNATTGKWLINPENSAYAREFGGFIRVLGERYDGNPDLDLVDISILAAWGEGAGTNLLTDKTRRALVDSYMDSFHKTPLVTQLGDEKTVAYTLSKSYEAAGNDAAAKRRAASLGEQRPHVGWRADCLGDLGSFSKTFNLMTDAYPEAILKLGLENAWKTAPVTMEACGVMQDWKNRGWDLQSIIDQSIQWHMSSFNAKSSPVPVEWRAQVNDWLNRMGYRFVLRRFTYPATIDASRKLVFTSWWENKGDAPAYRRYPLALRLKSDKNSVVVVTDADVRTWMPGDNLYNNSAFVPRSLPDGDYTLEIALVDPTTRQPEIKLAIAGVEPDGWYPLGAIKLSTAAVPAGK